MENISGIEFAYLNRCLLESSKIKIAALVDVFRGPEAGSVVQRGPKSVVRRYLVGDQEIYLKLYRWRRISRWLRIDRGYCRALKAMENTFRLTSLGIKTAPVLALVRRDRNCSPAASGLFTLSLSPAQTISRYLVERLSSRQAGTQRREILRRLAEFLWNIHEKQIYPKDFKDGNILIRRISDHYCFYLVDYDSFLFSRSISSRRRLKNLYQIGSTLRYALSEGEVEFFLQAYCERRPSLSGRVGALQREIETNSRSKAAAALVRD